MLRHTDQQALLSGYMGLASDAAALTLESGGDVEEAFQLLEIGRGVMATVCFDARNDLTDLEMKHAEYAKEFKFIQTRLDPFYNPDPSQWGFSEVKGELLVNYRYEIVAKFEKLLASIRKLEGFEKFLQGPSVEGLSRLAFPGPLVAINVSRFGCQAIIATEKTLGSIQLPKLLYDDLKSNAKRLLQILEGARVHTWYRSNLDLTEILEWLWDVVAEPILDYLGFLKLPNQDSECRHICWLPTGLLTLFPIHAAGRYNTARRTDGVMDLVISSYTATARSLQYLKDQVLTVGPTPSQSILLAAMEETVDRAPLASARREIDVILGRLPSSVRKMHLLNPTKQELMDNLDQCSLLHITCHGEVSHDPSESRLLLTD